MTMCCFIVNVYSKKNMADMSGHLFCSSGQLLFYLYV
jgi:hypothetical protein